MNKVLILSNEYPPHVYGGAGVHVDNLSRELAHLVDVEVRCFGARSTPAIAGKPAVQGAAGPAGGFPQLPPGPRKVAEALGINLEWLGTPVDADVVHCHTWYSMMAGVWAKILYDLPLVITTHSLEPLRPWKEDQLGRGYHLSSWIERTAITMADAIIAVSEATRDEVLACYPVEPHKVHVIHNGIDLSVFNAADPAATLEKYDIDRERPYLLFVGRITRQKGVIHLVRALEHVTPSLDIVLCAGAPDTEEIAAEMEAAVRAEQVERTGIHWVREMVGVDDLVRLYSGAAVFVCPSIYEPFGIINLEAMACNVPVVASRVGGIPEVVKDGETGRLVGFEANPAPDFEPRDPARFSQDLAAAVNEVVADESARRRMGEAGRRRVEEHFSWESIARKTVAVYESVLADRNAGREAQVASR